MPLVTVIIPVYNGAHTLGRPLESLLAQTVKNMEIIVVDDHSDDDSLDFVHAFLKDSPISWKTFSLYRRQGVSAARNLGIAEASGDLLFFLDADDYLERSCLEKLSCLFQADEQVDVAFCGFQRVTVSGKTIQYYEPKKKYLTKAVSGPEALRAFWNKRIDLHMTSTMVRKSFILENKINFHKGCIYREDFEFHSKILLNARKVASHPEEMSFYVVDESTTTGKKEFMKKAAIHELSVFLRLKKILKPEDKKNCRLLDRYILHGYVELLSRALEAGDLQRFYRLKKSPLVRKALILSCRWDILFTKPEYLFKILYLFMI